MGTVARAIARVTIRTPSNHSRYPKIAARAAGMEAGGGCWRDLGCRDSQLQLRFTLPTGQSFRWWPAGDPDIYIGVVGERIVGMRQRGGAIEYATWGPGADQGEGDREALLDYFNLGGGIPELSDMCGGFAGSDPHFAALQPHFPGARVMRQDPLECLLSFVCSSNNHISRIHGMVDSLAAGYGTPLGPPPAELAGGGAPAVLHAFPTLDQLAGVEEQALRDAGFGYRAKFIAGTVEALRAQPEGGDKWLLSLRELPYKEASAALCSLPGVGPKVAACACLFSLDKHEAVPVDTHVWQATTRLYMPELTGKSLTPKVMEAVEAAWAERFGPFCGWAHNTVFLSELAQHRDLLPVELQPPPRAKKQKQAKRAAPGGDLDEGGGASVTPAGGGGGPEVPRKSTPAAKRRLA